MGGAKQTEEGIFNLSYQVAMSVEDKSHELLLQSKSDMLDEVSIIYMLY